MTLTWRGNQPPIGTWEFFAVDNDGKDYGPFTVDAATKEEALAEAERKLAPGSPALPDFIQWLGVDAGSLELVDDDGGGL